MQSQIRFAAKRFFGFKRQINYLNFDLRKRSIASFGLVSGTATLTYILYNHYEKLQSSELSRDHFTPYRISYRQDIDDAHFFIELTPVVSQKVNLWKEMASEKIWSVQVKQPQIMVVRNYTPLPLIYNRENGSIEVMKDGGYADGKLFFYMKQYKNGEVARWLHGLPEGEVVELRGPYIEYELPRFENELVRSRDFLISPGKTEVREESFRFQPFDIAMYTAGTGIVAALQLMLTESPFRGSIDLFYSCKNFDELGYLKSIILDLQKHKRLQLHLSESAQVPQRESRLAMLFEASKNPVEYRGLEPFKGLTHGDIKPVLSLICGPESFIDSVAGPRQLPEQGPVGGILQKKGWTSDNIYKLL